MDLIERSEHGAQRHPWEIARATFFCRLLKRNDLLDSDTWLDVGSGDAWFAKQLLRSLPTTASVEAWDVFYTPEEVVGQSSGRLQLTIEQPHERFDRVLLMDVIEHIEDDRGFLRGILDKNLNADGRVLITVPAYQKLFSEHDVQLRHFRRYSPRECRSLIADCGLEICKQGGLFHSLLIARAIAIGIEKLRKKSSQQGIGRWTHGDFLTKAVLAALQSEARLSVSSSRRGLTVPGLTYWALCKRTSDSV